MGSYSVAGGVAAVEWLGYPAGLDDDPFGIFSAAHGRVNCG